MAMGPSVTGFPLNDLARINVNANLCWIADSNVAELRFAKVCRYPPRVFHKGHDLRSWSYELSRTHLALADGAVGPEIFTQLLTSDELLSRPAPEGCSDGVHQYRDRGFIRLILELGTKIAPTCCNERSSSSDGT